METEILVAHPPSSAGHGEAFGRTADGSDLVPKQPAEILSGPWIEIIEQQNANEDLFKAYERVKGARGKLATIHKVHSLNPRALEEHMALYQTLLYRKSPLSRFEREMLGVVVSKSNSCSYCIAHHVAPMRHYLSSDRDESWLDAFKTDWSSVQLSEREHALCKWASVLTINPALEASQRWSQVQSLKSAGLTDREILDANMVIAYFNFVNRMVLGLGLGLNLAASSTNPGSHNIAEGDELQGYRY